MLFPAVRIAHYRNRIGVDEHWHCSYLYNRCHRGQEANCDGDYFVTGLILRASGIGFEDVSVDIAMRFALEPNLREVSGVL